MRDSAAASIRANVTNNIGKRPFALARHKFDARHSLCRDSPDILRDQHPQKQERHIH